MYRHDGETTFYTILIFIVIGFILLCFESCWSNSVAEDDVYQHKYIVIEGKYYDTREDIESISADVVMHDKHVITIRFKDGTVYQTQEGQYTFAETKPETTEGETK